MVIETFPAVLGVDGAGIVQEVGSTVTTLKKGDRMCVRCICPPGALTYTNTSLFQPEFDVDHAAFQQYTLVRADFAAPVSS